MKRFYSLVFAGLLFAFLSAPASASIVGSYLNFNGTLNTIRDDSVGILTRGEDGALASLATPTVGDRLWGVFKVNDINNVSVPSSGDSIWGIYALEVKSMVNNIAVLGATPGAIQSLIASLGLSTPAYAKSGSIATDATLLLVQTGSNVQLPNLVTSSTNYDTNFVSTLQGVIDPSWSASMVLGLVKSTDFHEVVINSAATAEYALTYSVIADEFGGVLYNPVTGLDQPTTIPGFLQPGTPGIGDFVTVANATITLKPPTEPSLNKWAFSDKGDFGIAPTPEPGALAIWTILAGIGVFVYRRRKS